MKFLYADTQDYVDPDYDFINERHGAGRERGWTDAYPHELMQPTPYDGLLLSMSAIRQAKGVAASKVRYSTREAQRLLRDGVRRFVRLDAPHLRDAMLMGDCGAFAYVDQPMPAFSPAEVAEFYLEAGFTHGVSPDHIIFDCDPTNPPASAVAQATRDRYEITLANADEFLNLTRHAEGTFEPVGAVQGWSPQSIAEAAVHLEKMGYRYLAIGGLVPLRVDAIRTVLATLRAAIKPSTNIHLLGFAKADDIDSFTGYGITSFDSTSPLIRAFKDSKANYYLPTRDGGIDYYTAIRIPQAMENSRLLQGIKRGIFSAEDLQGREQRALTTLRALDAGQAGVEETIDAVMDYHRFLVQGSDDKTQEQQGRELTKTRTLIARTVRDRPWQLCNCDICRTAGVEVIIFRSSNRNKRRGFHNLGVYHQHVKNIREVTA